VSDRGFFLTWNAVRRQLAAMPNDFYFVRMIHRFSRKPSPGERIWDADHLARGSVVRWQPRFLLQSITLPVSLARNPEWFPLWFPQCLPRSASFDASVEGQLLVSENPVRPAFYCTINASLVVRQRYRSGGVIAGHGDRISAGQRTAAAPAATG
jgi:hypothetical protein